MSTIIVLLAVFFGLFLVAYSSKRRFGVLGLALTAGATLSNYWTRDLAPIIKDLGIEVSSPTLIAATGSIIILLPALVLLFKGPSHSKGAARTIGAIAFALLGTVLLIQPISYALVTIDYEVLGFVTKQQTIIVTAGILYAILDILASKHSKHR